MAAIQKYFETKFLLRLHREWDGGQEEKTNKQEGRLFRSSLCTHISMQFSSRKNGTWERFILVSISSIFVCRDSIFVNVARVDSLPQVCAFLSLDSLLAA